MTDSVNTSAPRQPAAAFAGGATIGALGGLIGLGGAEFRLPILIGFFNFAALEAVILNKAMSLVVVATALPFRAGTVPFSAIADNWSIVFNLLAGSLIGAWFGAGFHEDGLQAGLAVAEQLGGVRRPWDVPNESGRIPLGLPAATALEPIP